MTIDTITTINAIIFDTEFGEEKLFKHVNVLQKKSSKIQIVFNKILTFIVILIVANHVQLKAVFP